MPACARLFAMPPLRIAANLARNLALVHDSILGVLAGPRNNITRYNILYSKLKDSAASVLKVRHNSHHSDEILIDLAILIHSALRFALCAAHAAEPPRRGADLRCREQEVGWLHR